MTVAIAVPLKNHIVLGADSRCTSGSRLTGSVDKIYRLGPAAVAGAGSLGATQAVIAQAALDRVQTAVEFAACLRQCRGADETEWLWAGPDGLWEVDGNGGAVQRFEATCIGSGGEHALGVLAGLGQPRGKDQTVQFVTQALELTGLSYVDCGGPYSIVLV